MKKNKGYNYYKSFRNINSIPRVESLVDWEAQELPILNKETCLELP
jgi:hypothetical protein